MKTSQRTTSWNWPKGARAQEVALKFISSNPFFTILIHPTHLVENRVVRLNTAFTLIQTMLCIKYIIFCDHYDDHNIVLCSVYQL